MEAGHPGPAGSPESRVLGPESPETDFGLRTQDPGLPAGPAEADVMGAQTMVRTPASHNETSSTSLTSLRFAGNPGFISRNTPFPIERVKRNDNCFSEMLERPPPARSY